MVRPRRHRSRSTSLDTVSLTQATLALTGATLALTRATLTITAAVLTLTAAPLTLTPRPASAQEVIELPAADRLVHADFPEVYRVGDGGRGWELLSRVTSLSFDARGNLCVGDLSGQALEVIVVDPKGELVTRFGRQGDGPGEFRQATAAFALPDGRIVVPDKGRLAYHIFGRDGAFERMVWYPGVGEDFVPSPGRYPSAADPRLRKVDRWGGDLLLRVTNVWEVRFDSLTRRGGIKVVSGPRRVMRLNLGGRNAAEEAIASGTNPDADAAFLFAPLPGGTVAFSDSSAYEIRVAGATGAVSRVIRRPLPRRVWNDRNRRAYRRLLERELRAQVADNRDAARMGSLWGRRRQDRRRDRRSRAQRRHRDRRGACDDVGGLPLGGPHPQGRLPRVFDFREHLRTIVSDVHGGARPRRPGPIDIIAPGGEYRGTLGEARMPGAFGPDGLVAYLEMDALDVPTIVVRRLPRELRE